MTISDDIVMAKASAAACRRLILLFLEARIVAGNALHRVYRLEVAERRKCVFIRTRNCHLLM